MQYGVFHTWWQIGGVLWQKSPQLSVEDGTGDGNTDDTSNESQL
jgi:hypothetical protein